MRVERRTIRVNDYFSVLAPKCPGCGRTDKMEVDGNLKFRCTRCDRELTKDEVNRGQKEVEG